ncbi:polysaccharide biosynthesis/export family protein [Roseivirga sp.]|uniref:polysaccharide biosynthesis/export family protein n=1 Tax=Roseivirga sp. TaxID=1964215 RepID=UPI003B8E62B2
MMSGCNVYPTLVNYQPLSSSLQPEVISNYKPIRLETGDILKVEVSSVDLDAVAVYKDFQTSGYLIDSKGNIDFPLAGQIKLAGKTIEEAKIEVLEKLSKYFKVQPTINLALTNFKVTINGEVGSPRVLSVQNDRINIIEAVVTSGDFTPYSNRDSVMVVRETDGVRSFGYVNFNSNQIFKSPYFYLKQDDIIYVKPEKRVLGNIRTRQDKILPYVSVGISVILLAFTISRNR